jgi:putative ABC transport system permease protein
MAIWHLALKSLRNRLFVVVLTVATIALSVSLLLGVERIRRETRTSFTNTISGTDLIVGARSGAVPLLLSTVFRIGNPTANISWESHEALAARPEVAWIIPLVLGDSHRGYRVLGTTGVYFDHYRYARDRRLVLAAGTPLGSIDDAVLGSEIAAKLGYTVGQEIVVAHGAGEVSFLEHDDRPFRVVGVLAPTGTPVDRTVHVSLAGIDRIHAGFDDHDPLAGMDHEHAHDRHWEPRSLTAVLVGLKSRAAALQVQRFVNEYDSEPLTAILPGLALQELWSLLSVAERALLVVSGFVVVVGLAGMLTALLTSLEERRREMAILRSLGARPVHVFSLVVGEAGLLTLGGALAGVAALYGLLLAARPIIESRLGLFIAVGAPSGYEIVLFTVVCLAGLLVGVVPGYRIYRHSLADGLTIRF